MSPPPRTFEGLHLRLEGDLERHLGMPVDLAVLNTAAVDLRIRVLRYGKLLIEQDRSRRIQFEVKTRNEFFDLEPVLLQYRGIRRNKA
jgi:predicted nucleotidyltransferase